MNDAHVTPCYISLYRHKSVCCQCLKMHSRRYVYWRYLCTTPVLLRNVNNSISVWLESHLKSGIWIQVVKA